MSTKVISRKIPHNHSTGSVHIGSFVKGHLMPIVAVLAAAVTCFFVPFDEQYLGYFDLKTLATLFCTLAVVAAYKNIGFFSWLAKKIVLAFGTLRRVVFALVLVTYVGSMILANDMALITFLPLGFVAMDSCNRRDKLPLVFVMQNVAANLGGMLTPFGNPQNLYLYSHFQLGFGEFVKIMALPFAVALLLIVGVCFSVKGEKVTLFAPQESTPSVWRSITYGVLFVLSLLIVFNVLPWYFCIVVVLVALLASDYKAVLRVDYGLLLTFAAFFVFSGNLARIPSVSDALSRLVATSPLLVGVGCCQFISNVPTAVLLSQFTTDYTNLLVAVSIGGLGTPIASLASLITLNEFRKREPQNFKKYIATFLLINFSFLVILVVTQLIANTVA